MITDKTPKVYLSKRNLLALLSKLERDSNGDETACTIIKYQQPGPEYRQTMATIAVIAVQDEEYYGAQNRAAGEMHPSDEVKLEKPSKGTYASFDL
jgi:hypothetical protein